MNDDQQAAPRPDETQPVRAAGPAPRESPRVAAETPAEAPPGRRRFRERLRSLRRSDGNRTFGLAALLASALAGVIVGGLGTAAVHAVTHDGPRDHGGWVHRDDRAPGPDGRGGMERGPRGVPGQLPPTTPPEGEGSDSGSSS
ncbi:hypothetical protein [Nocardioides xinjiangensis]|uniref:hypothetical protein n=1 Tax=Nocardioides xinjiangensis TaxID=2817376 RepID=UPI001B311208|nr:MULTISPECIES: hypothetical protein [unclassified Nocardioides]